MTAYSIVGMHHAGSAGFVQTIGKGEPIRLVREPDNPYDANAIKVFWQDRFIGYIKRDQAAVLAPLLDATKDTGASGRFVPGLQPAIELETDVG